MKLRDYQLQVIKDTYQFFKLGLKSVLVYAPKGWILDMLLREFGCDKYYNLQSIEWWKVGTFWKFLEN